MATLAPTDVLVAVTDRNVTAALLMGDKLYWAEQAATTAHTALLDAEAAGLPETFLRRYRRNDESTASEYAVLAAEYAELVAGLPPELLKRVTATVWRDRVAEYAHAREVAEKEKNQR